jgi:hypothetical protein
VQIPVEGFMYPNEVELQWSILIVLYPFITGLVAGAFILASLERVFRVDAVKPTYRLALLIRDAPDAAATAAEPRVRKTGLLRWCSRSCFTA